MITKLLLSLFIITAFQQSFAADYLDTQFGQDGIEVHLLKAKNSNNVLTVSFMFENSTGKSVTLTSLVITDANYTSSDKKFPVLKDANDKWLASTVTYEKGSAKDALFTYSESPNHNHTLYFNDGSKRVAWLKFESPSDEDWPIELTLPGVSPFTIEKP